MRAFYVESAQRLTLSRRRELGRSGSTDSKPSVAARVRLLFGTTATEVLAVGSTLSEGASMQREFWRIPLRMVLLAMILRSPLAADDARIEGGSQLEVTVGMAGSVKQVVLPGSELTVKEVNPRRTPIAIRIDSVFPHGDNFRYDLTWFGLEPGTHNLCEYLTRQDGSSTEDLPQINVTVNTILPAGELHPNAADAGLLARIGGYRNTVVAVIFLWVAGLLAILFWGRSGKTATERAAAEVTLTPVEHIQQLIDRALENGALEAADKADLEVRILNFWRQRRNLGDTKVADALAELKQDEQAGPLLAGIERWFYSRDAPGGHEIKALLQPMAEVVAKESSPELSGV